MVIRRKIIGIVVGTLLSLAAVAVVLPIIVIAIASFGEGFAVYMDFYIWEPKYLYAMIISFIVAAASATGAVIVAALAAYVFAKIKFRGSSVIFYMYIIVMMMPFQVTLLPQYITSKTLGTYDTLLALILPGIFAPFAVFLLTQIMKTVPNEVIEAAKLDTSSTLVIIARIILPAIRPGLICTWILAFTEQWNAVAEPLVLIETQDKYPVAVILSEASPEATLTFAAVLMFMILPFLLFILFEKEVMEGLGEYKIR